MKKIILNLFLVVAFSIVASINSFGQIEIEEEFGVTCSYYRSFKTSQKPSDYSRLQREVRFAFSENQIKMYRYKQGVFNSSWELETTYRIIKSQKRKDGNGDIYYLYETDNKVQIGYNSGSIKNIMILSGNNTTEYISE